MQLIDKSQLQVELKTANSTTTEPQGKLSTNWKVVEGKLVCFWSTQITSNHNHEGGKTMELCYRGVSYDDKPLVVETTVGEVGGKYRDRDWRFRNLKKPTVFQPKVNLTYRAVNYNKLDTITTSTIEPKKTSTVSTG